MGIHLFLKYILVVMSRNVNGPVLSPLIHS